MPPTAATPRAAFSAGAADGDGQGARRWKTPSENRPQADAARLQHGVFRDRPRCRA